MLIFVIITIRGETWRPKGTYICYFSNLWETWRPKGACIFIITFHGKHGDQKVPVFGNIIISGKTDQWYLYMLLKTPMRVIKVTKGADMY